MDDELGANSFGDQSDSDDSESESENEYADMTPKELRAEAARIRKQMASAKMDERMRLRLELEDIEHELSKNSFGGGYPDYDLNRSFQPPMDMYGDPGGNTYDRLSKKRYLPPYAPGVSPVSRGYSTPQHNELKVRPNNNPTGWLTKAVPVSGTRYGMDKRPFNVQPMVVANQEAAGNVMAGQPLDLWRYQNTDYGSYNYPSFLGPRYWMGGYGRDRSPSRRRKRSIGEGDVIEVYNGKINVRNGK